MRGSRRNKIHPRGNPATVRSIYSRNIHTHTRGFRGIPAVPIPVNTSISMLTSYMITIYMRANNNSHRSTDGQTDMTERFIFLPANAGPILSVFPALIVHSELKSVHPGFPVAFIF